MTLASRTYHGAGCANDPRFVLPDRFRCWYRRYGLLDLCRVGRMKKSTVDDRYMARVYLAQAKATKHRDWAFVLLGWAAKCRLASMEKQRPLL